MKRQLDVSETETLSNSKPPADRWRLWVDGCGGFLLLAGHRWSVGGASSAWGTDVRIQADLPRRAGVITRQEDRYFWNSAEKPESAVPLQPGHPLPITSSATLVFRQPSPLSGSGVLTLQPPHRFDGHVDGIIFAADTLLIGPTADCHVQLYGLQQKVVMTRRADQWLAKVLGTAELAKLPIGTRVAMGEIEMTLENA
ncbi:hypothetical protein Pla52o_18820 [Novipirellula galeiformis]|uniref:Uncharacterized protein n=1 Tax=Novipirellula galeiformis TaxID=2528004 RepID=A0A5C6CM88_9BACT|nr:hypothetical protein Pla52o_18820 [Novipirellula galeiformis]